MNIAQKTRWVGAAIVAVCACIGATSGAATRTVESALQVHSGTCTPPTGSIYVMQTVGTASGVLHCNVLAPVAPVGQTSFSACDVNTGTFTMNLRGAVGLLNTTTADFTAGGTGATAGPVSWANGNTVHLSVSSYSPAAGCFLDGQGTGAN